MELNAEMSQLVTPNLGAVVQHHQSLVPTANREVRLRTEPGVALSCLSPLPVLLMSLWLMTGVEGSDEE